MDQEFWFLKEERLPCTLESGRCAHLVVLSGDYSHPAAIWDAKINSLH
jgi:hypothetical protein